MKKYYIYHLKGKKIGCTENPKKRTKAQGFDNYEILEEHTDIYIASDREIELQKLYGYPIDKIPYWKTIKISTTSSCSKGGKTNVESGHLIKTRKISAENRSIPIIQMDKLGNPIKEFPSAIQASIILGIWQQNITSCCRGKLKIVGGFTFKYK